MIFTTVRFAACFAVFYLVYRVVPRTWRQPLLLCASYLFYMSAIPAYAAIILLITLIDFSAGIRIEVAVSLRRKRAWLLASIVSNLAILFVFKYSAASATTLNDSMGTHLPVMRFLLPIGLSFHTFQAISYTVEVFRGRWAAERSLMRYALYVSFFPQMVAGPIERPFGLLAQLRESQSPDAEDVRAGLKRVLWGVYKKLVVADLLGKWVDLVYASPRIFSGSVLLVATLFFAFQIYCDFSGYSDIAIGIARMMGYRLMENFRQPYFAVSIRDFWRRWHISLSTWFRDYVFIPLGGSRVSRWRYLFNILAVFALSGIWHGSKRSFALWGLLHGVYYISGQLTRPVRESVITALGLERSSRGLAVVRMVFTFSLVTMAWVLFRAETVTDAIYIVGRILGGNGFAAGDFFAVGLPYFELAFAPVAIASVMTVEWAMSRPTSMLSVSWQRPMVRTICYNACLFAIVCFGVFGGTTFIYFQF